MAMENTTSGFVFPQGAPNVGGSPDIIYNYMPPQISNYVLNGDNIVYVLRGQNFENRQNNGYPVEITNCILPLSVQTTPQVTDRSSLAEVVRCDVAAQTDEVTPENVVKVQRSERRHSKGESGDASRNGTLEEAGVLSPETVEVESQLNLFSESMRKAVQERAGQSQTGVLAHVQAVTAATQKTTSSATSSVSDTTVDQRVPTSETAFVSWFPENQQQWQQYLQQQMPQKQLQPQTALVNLKLPNGQVLPGFVQDTTNNDVPAAAWSVSPPGSLQVLCSFLPGNTTQVQGLPFPGLQGVQIQGGNEQQVVADAHSSQNLGLASDATTVSTVPYRQMAPEFSPDMAAHGTLIRVQRLQQDASDPSKWYVITEGDDPTSVEVLAQQSPMIDSTTSSAALWRDEVPAQPSSSSSGVHIRKGKRRQPCPCANCVHGRNKGLRRKSHICSIPGCGKVYRKSFNLKTHLLWHSERKPYVCDWVPCGKRFNRYDELQRHYRIHTGERRYECSKCKRRFLRSDHLSNHMRSHLRRRKGQPLNAGRSLTNPKSHRTLKKQSANVEEP